MTGFFSCELEDELHQTKEEQAQNDYSYSWLANVRYLPERPPVCFEFARYGRCISGRNVSIPITLMTWQSITLRKCWDEMVLRLLEKQPRHWEAMQGPSRCGRIWTQSFAGRG